MRRYLVVSDLHLCDFEDHADGGMAHKSPRFRFDEDFADLLREFQASARADDQLGLIRSQWTYIGTGPA